MSESFDPEAFLEWLDDHDGPVTSSEMVTEWPNFPYGELDGCTGPIIDEEFCYYQCDLRKVAKGMKILD